MQYFLTLGGFVVGLLLLYFLAWRICSLFTWQFTDPLYRLLNIVQETFLFWGSGLILAGWALITYRFFQRPLRYLDEVIAASEKLAHPEGGPIVLPEAISNIQDELNLVREEALRSTMAAKEAEQRKNDLVVYLAHDLKTPLTSVIGYLTLLRDEPLISPDLRAKYTGIALEKAARLETLVNEFFEITRFNLTRLILEMKPVNLTRLLEQLTFEFKPLLEEKSLCWALHLTPNVQLTGDPNKLERVFDNLIRNAINYSYPQKEIALTLEPAGDQVRIALQNYGRPLPPEKLERIFEQFFRLDSARSTATGQAGLGLAIAKTIVEHHGGVIKAESAGEEITFTVLLPQDRQEIV